METYKDILLYDILHTVEVKNKVYKSLLKEQETIESKGKIYKYDSAIRQTIPFQTSFYCKHIDSEHFRILAEYGNTKLKLAFYVYNMIKNRHDVDKRVLVKPNYSHNIAINAREAEEYIGLKHTAYYDLLKDIANDTRECIRIEGNTARIKNLDFVPPLLLEEDGSFSLNYMLSPFYDTRMVLIHEEDEAIERHSNGTPYERKRWGKRIMQSDVISLKDCLHSNDNTLYGSIMRHIARMIFNDDGFAMNPCTYDIVFDYELMIKNYKEESGEDISEFSIRKVIRNLVKRELLFEDGRTKNRNKIYHINVARLRVN